MINVILHGAEGKMGKTLQEKICASEKFNVTGGIDKNLPPEALENNSCSFPLYTSLKDCTEDADVIIDFSHHTAVNSVLRYAEHRNLPVVIATTALDESNFILMNETSKKIPVFHSFNMSLGINAISQALKNLMPFFEEDFNVEIIEKHHNMKLDSPSGTALLLADAINDSCRTKKDYIYGRHGKADECKLTDLGIHAVRGGTICGEHTVIYAGPDEVIEITHRALSRDIFANGALKAAGFLVGQKAGIYSMKDMLRNV